MTVCPYCGCDQRQVKAGRNEGLQRYKCMSCRRRYTSEPRARGYSEDLHRKAAALYAEGMKIRWISRQLGVSAQSIVNWVRQPAEEAMQGTPPPSAAARSVDAVVPGKQRPTIRDVAQRAGVSNSTVSNYLNNKGRMSEATESRVRAAMEDLHFTPSALTRAIRQRRTHILGVMIFGLSELDENIGRSLAPPLLAGINSAAHEAEHHILLYTGLRYHAQYPVGVEFLDGHIDGLIWVAPAMRDPALERAAAAGLPIVSLLARHVPDRVGFVNADNPTSMQMLVAHLAQQGHRRIAYVGSIYNSNFLDRRDGYRKGLAASGLPWDRALEEVGATIAHSFKDYAQALDRWLALPAPPTAIMAQDDGGAEWMIQLIQERGLRIPEEIAVTGFDDIPDAKRIAGGLTTLRQPFREMGKLAVERLIALIAGAPVSDCRLTVPTQLIVRRSSAAIPER